MSPAWGILEYRAGRSAAVAPGAASRQDSHRVEAGSVRRLGAGWLRTRGLRGPRSAPASAAALEPTRHRVRDEEEKEEWKEVRPEK